MGKKRILFTGGGSGGHIMPVLAVMAAVEEQAGSEIDLWYAGLHNDVQSPGIRQSDIRFRTVEIRSGKLNRFMTWKHLGQFGNFVIGLFQAEWVLFRVRPRVIFAKGGFVGVPIVLAAARRGLPVFCHESDAVLGLANRIVARFARRVFTAFPASSYPSLPKKKVRHVGQPVRPEFLTPSSGGQLGVRGRALSADLPVVTVTGGSQGARRINELISSVWPLLLERVQLVHICGPNNLEELQQAAKELPDALAERLVLVPFVLEELPELFKRSAVVVSRAGGAVAELAATRATAVLLPLSTAAQDHQAANARLLEQEGAAVVLDELATSPEELAATVLGLIDDPVQRAQLSESIAAFARPDAAAEMARELVAAVSRRRG